MSIRTGNPGAGGGTPLTNPVLVGTTIVVGLIVAVFLSYNANKGLPFVQTFPLKAKVPDAQQLVEGSEVRIGGFRVGQVVEIEAKPAQGNAPPYAEIQMKLDPTLDGIPQDTEVRVRPRSLLGAKFVELVPGRSSEMVEEDATLPLANAQPTNELDEIFNTFDRPTREGLQATIRNFGDSVAGRGPDINRALVAVDELLPPLQRLAELLADPSTDLAGFVDQAADFAAAFAPVADELGVLFDDGATTLAAIDAAGSSFGEGIEELPPTEAIALKTMTDISPVLRDLADITVGLRAGTRQLPRSTAALTEALRSGTQVLQRTPELTDPLDTTLTTLGVVSRDPAAAGSVSKLTEALGELQPALDSLYDAQVGCNLAPVNLRNQSQAVSRGDQQGTWLSFLPIVDLVQGTRSTAISPDTHYNPYPILRPGECEAGNEPYLPGQQLGNPSSTEPAGPLEDTRPPQEAVARARAAGLMPFDGDSR